MKNILNWIVFFSVMLVFGCSVTKQNQKAVNRVKADINLLNDVGGAWALLNPCIPDQPKPGKTITIIDSSFAKENIDFLNGIIDSLLDKNCPTENIDSLRNAIRKEVAKNCQPVVINHYRVDTVPDKRAIKQAETALQTANLIISKQEGEKSQLQAQNSDLKKENKNKTWWLIGISVFAVLAIGGLTFLLFKK